MIARLVVAILVAVAAWVLPPGTSHDEAGARVYAYDVVPADAFVGTPATRLEYAYAVTDRVGQRYDGVATFTLGKHVPALRLLAAEGGGGGLTTLYRAMSPGEFADATGSQLFRAGPQSMEGKFFALNPEHAAEMGAAILWRGSVPYRGDTGAEFLRRFIDGLAET